MMACHSLSSCLKVIQDYFFERYNKRILRSLTTTYVTVKQLYSGR